MPSLSIHRANTIPPYGRLNSDFFNAVKDLQMPPHWLIGSKTKTQQRLDHFNRWFQETLGLINEALWPKYDQRRQEWQGKSTQHMQQLTDLDLRVMLDIQTPKNGAKRFDQDIESPLRSLDVKTHSNMFSLEDQGGGSHMFDGLPFYNKLLDDKTAKAVANLCWQADHTKKGNVSFLFKNALQRPRPMQMALRSKQFEFTYRDAGTAGTPSMSSGHCLQGVLCVGAVVERFLDDGTVLTGDAGDAIGRWAVDIGDRRVLAGVHYPTDSLCSWIIFLRMADHVFHQRQVKALMADAIKNHSFVHATLRRWAKTAAGQTYRAPLELLDKSMPV